MEHQSSDTARWIDNIGGVAAGNEGARGTADPTGQRRNDARRPRAQARAAQQLLSDIAHLQSHRGRRPTLLGAALARALASEPDAAAQDEAVTRAAAQAHLAAFRAEQAAALVEKGVQSLDAGRCSLTIPWSYWNQFR